MAIHRSEKMHFTSARKHILMQHGLLLDGENGERPALDLVLYGAAIRHRMRRKEVTMKSVSKTVFAVMLLVLAMSAVSSASASAAECKHTAKSTTFCVEKQTTTGEVGFTATPVGSAEISFYSKNLDCSKVTDTGVFHPAGAASILIGNRVIELSECRISSPAGCAVVEPIVLGEEHGASGLAGEIYLSESAFLIQTFPAKAITFGTISFKGKGAETCYITGHYALNTELGNDKEGPICSLPGVTSEAVEHEVKCIGGNTSHLTFDDTQAGLTLTEKVALSGTYKGKKWSLWEQ